MKKAKLIIISNRLPVTIEKENKKLSFKSSAGGLVSGLSTSVETIMSLTGSKRIPGLAGLERPLKKTHKKV